MLSILRHKGVSRKILWGVAVIIILSFGVFGTAYRLDTTINSAGKIFKKSVSLRDYERAYLDSRDQAIMTYGERFFKMGNQLDLEREAWERLMLLHEVKKQGIKISDKEVVEFIAVVPFFQHDGKFDQFAYESIVRNPSVFDRRTKDFELGIRNSLAIKKLLDLVAGPIVITNEELKKEYIKKNEKIKLTYALISPADFESGITTTAEEIRKFYDAHKEGFKQPPMINAQYVHLLWPEKATDAQKATVKKEALAIAHDLTPSADFAAIAKKHNTEAKDSGFFTQEQPLLTFAWSPEFVDKLFAMKKGEISNPMETPDGWQVVKIKEKTDAAVPEFAAILDKVKTATINDRALQAAQTKAGELLKTIRGELKTKDFKTITTELGLKTEETTAFSRGEYINAPGLIAEFQEESLNLNNSNKLGSVVTTSQGPAILYLSSIEPIEDKKFAEDKEDFKQMMTAQKRNQAITTFVTKLKFEAALKTDLKDKIRYR